MPATELLIPANTGTSLHCLQDTLRVLATNKDTTGTYEVFELTGPANSGPPPHYHPWGENFFILEGEVELLVGQNSNLATPGTFASVPGGCVHTYRIVSPTARFLVMTHGRGASEFFQDLDREIDMANFDMDKLMEVATRHHVVPVNTN
jgi:quercetin dioxygenase-like cupin family protein